MMRSEQKHPEFGQKRYWPKWASDGVHQQQQQLKQQKQQLAKPNTGLILGILSTTNRANLNLYMYLLYIDK